MVTQPVSVTHSLAVTAEFSIQPVPPTGLLTVPLRAAALLECRITGPGAQRAEIKANSINIVLTFCSGKASHK